MSDEVDSVIAPRRECFLEEFKEVSEILQIIRNVGSIIKDQVSFERSLERFSYVISQYQEQPHLLDPHLKTLLDELLKSIKENLDNKPVVHLASKFLYILTKTRGYKVIGCILPHEVSDLHILLSLFSGESFQTSEAFECKYILLLWLSIVCIVPFDLSRFDDVNDLTKTSTCDKIYNYGQNYLGCNNRCQEIAALMLARFLTRPDVRSLKLNPFITWALDVLSNPSCSTEIVSLKTGVLLAFASLFKHGSREVVSAYAEKMFDKIEEHELLKSNNAKIRKLSIKVIQRVGLAFLRPRLAMWRYKRGLRSLSDNLKVGASGDCLGFHGDVDVDEDDSDVRVPDIIEKVVEKLLAGLHDKDTSIRWSSAKGIGRVTGRLPLDLADEVVASVLELFSPSETEDAWHGACLCLGELGHRGLLLPRRLEEVVPLVEKSLIYDEKRGTCSVGSNVRDSASFICWSFARAYDWSVLQPFLDRLMRSLVVTCLFDREVKVRRAASAALQELVGRQGDITHGIDIITACDYFAVGNKNNCYLQLSVLISGYAGFQEPIIEHLMSRKVSHWDISIRELSGEALGLLVPKAVDFFLDSGLKTLLEGCTSDDFSTRHGSVIASAHVLFALTQVKEGGLENEAISGLLLKLEERKVFRGMHGDVMRKAFCFFINKLSQAKFKPNSWSLIDKWMEFLSECLHNAEVTVQAAALDALTNLLGEYHSKNITRIDNLMEECRNEVNNHNGHVRCAYALLLGNLPHGLLQRHGHTKEALDLLCQHALYYPQLTNHPRELLEHLLPPPNDSSVEERRDAIKGLIKLCQNAGFGKSGGLSRQDMEMVYEVLFVSINDYTLDDRGDVGTCVRESCMNAFHDITLLVSEFCPDVLTRDICQPMFCYLIQQSSEKIDRTRSTACEVFYKLLHHEPRIENIPEASLLRSLFGRDEEVNANWASPSYTFPKFVRLVSSDVYSYHLLLGTVVSAGGLTESLVKHSVTSLVNQLNFLTSDQIFDFGKTLLRIFSDNSKVDRVTIPTMKTIDKLLTNECFSLTSSENLDELARNIAKVCINEVNKSGDVKKLLASIDVFCGLLTTSEAVKGTCLGQLMVFLCHRFPLIRKSCAGRLYESLMIGSHLVDESHLEDVSNILIETDWDLPVEQLRPVRNSLCSLLNVPAPVLVKKKL